MIRICPPRSVWAIRSNLLRVDRPIVIYRSSSIECSSSRSVTNQGSSKMVLASPKLTRCFLRFDAALRSSHSKFRLIGVCPVFKVPWGYLCTRPQLILEVLQRFFRGILTAKKERHHSATPGGNVAPTIYLLRNTPSETQPASPGSLLHPLFSPFPVPALTDQQ